MFSNEKRTMISVAWICVATIILSMIVCVVNIKDFFGTKELLAPGINILSSIVVSFIVVLMSTVWISRRALSERRRLLDTDRLTGISNQYKFMKDAAAIIRDNEDKKYAVVRIDINRLSLINDIYGYDKCDELIRKISDSCLERLSDDELIGAVDSYFILLLEYDNQKQLDSRLDDLTAAIETAGSGDESAVRFDTSTGICLVDGGSTTDVRLLIDRTRMAREWAIGELSTRRFYYNDGTRARFIEERDIVEGLNAAIDLHQLVVYYQPKFDTKTMNVIGAEALVRWDHPSLGMLPPSRFIPFLEKDFHIGKLDLYVMEEVCRNIKKWQDEGKNVPIISVNVSRTHLLEENILEQYRGITEKIGVSPSCIELEITETSVNIGGEKLRNIISELRRVGFRIAIDDFGNGLSSLHLLSEIDADVLKMDCGLFREHSPEGRTEKVVLLIIELAKAVQMDIIAEGVETKEQCEFLCRSGCCKAQGAYFSGAVSAEKFEKIAFKISEGSVGEGLCCLLSSK